MSSILNRHWFWSVLLFANNILFAYLLACLNVFQNAWFIVKLTFLFYIVIAFLSTFVLIPKFASNLSIYGHWMGKKIAHKLQVHFELDELRDLMIFGEEDGEKYWEIILSLDETFFQENSLIKKTD
jgi:hypothetical protein